MNFLRKTTVIFIALFTAIFFASCGAKGSEGAGSSSPSSPSESGLKTPDNHYSVNTGQGEVEIPDIGGGEEPEALNVLFSRGAIRWDDVSAHVYIVKIDGKQVKSTSELSYVPSLPAGVYTAEVVAYLSLSPARTIPGQVEIVVRATPPTLSLDGNLIFWNATEGAAGYDIYKDGNLLCRVAESSFLAEQDGAYSVKVVFDDARLNSEMSEAVVVGALELTAPLLRLDGDCVRWSAVPGALFYVIFVEGAVAVPACPDTFFELAIMYAQQYAENFPDGIEVAVSARAQGVPDGPLSNVVIYKN